MKDFAITGTWEQLQDFKEISEEYGWIYDNNFSAFTKESFEHNPHLYYCDGFSSGFDSGKYFSLSNAAGIKTLLSNNYEECIEYISTNVKESIDELDLFLDWLCDNYNINNDFVLDNKSKLIKEFKER